MNQTPDDASPSGNDDLKDPRVARRAKLKQLIERGVDPWGQRFDDRDMIGECQEKAAEIRFVQEDGTDVPLPNFDDQSLDYRQWKADNGPGAEQGPTVRVSGRIMLSRNKGKLIFLTMRDWTGDIQIFIGKKQVGDDHFSLAKLFDIDDLVGAEGRLGRTNTGELTVFAEKLFFHTKMLEIPPEKHAGLTDLELRQRMRYADLAFNDGPMQTILVRSKNVCIGPSLNAKSA